MSILCLLICIWVFNKMNRQEGTRSDFEDSIAAAKFKHATREIHLDFREFLLGFVALLSGLKFANPNQEA